MRSKQESYSIIDSYFNKFMLALLNHHYIDEQSRDRFIYNFIVDAHNNRNFCVIVYLHRCYPSPCMCSTDVKENGREREKETDQECGQRTLLLGQ